MIGHPRKHYDTTRQVNILEGTIILHARKQTPTPLTEALYRGHKRTISGVRMFPTVWKYLNLYLV